MAIKTSQVVVGATGITVIGLGLYFLLRKKGKTTGSPTGATITFGHQGSGGIFQVGFGIAISMGFPAFLKEHNSVTHWFVDVVEILPHTTWTPVTVKLEKKPWPDIAPGKYDCLKIIQTETGILGVDGKGMILANWDDDIYEVEE